MNTRLKYKVVDKYLSVGKPISSPLKFYLLKKYGYNQIIDLRHHSKVSKLSEKFFAKLFNIKYKNIIFPTNNNEIPDIKFFRNINKEIKDNTGKTYLHCKHGIHRSSMCATAYLQENTKKNNSDLLSYLLQNFQANKIGNNARLTCILNKFINMFNLNK